MVPEMTIQSSARKKITSDICKALIVAEMQRFCAINSAPDFLDLVSLGPGVWKRLTKTSLGKLKTNPTELVTDGCRLFPRPDCDGNEGWCCFTAKDINDPKIIIREFSYDTGEGCINKLVGASIATDPVDKQFLGIAWSFDCSS